MEQILKVCANELCRIIYKLSGFLDYIRSDLIKQIRQIKQTCSNFSNFSDFSDFSDLISGAALIVAIYFMLTFFLAWG